MKTTEQIAVMQAFADGQEIEQLVLSSVGLNVQTLDWVKCDDPIWEWSLNDYRIAKSTQTYYEVMRHVGDQWFIMTELFTQADIDGSELIKTGREFQL